MTKSKEQDILEEVTRFFVRSRDFNGFPVWQLVSKHKKTGLDGLKQIFRSLVQQDKISLVFGDIHLNPHINAFPDESHEVQLRKLDDTNLLMQACVYPSASHLKTLVDVSLYEGKPFTLRLALGEPQLAFESFDLRVLEDYRNDPRYSYTTDDIQGSISVSDKYYESNEMHPSDQVLLQSFGFSYDSQLHRAVAVFLRYLSDLSPEHQQIWNARIVKGDYKLHPDYIKASMGSWDLGVSIFDAFIGELHIINDMSKLMGRQPLFKQELDTGNKPREFSFLVRPTLRELNAFIHLLDKLLSDNLNKKFFGDDIPLEREETRKKDGKIIVREKGTIQLLEEWLSLKVKVQEKEPLDQMLETFKEVRKLRQNPAHAINEDAFNQEYFQQQRELIKRVYRAARTIRLLFTNHPNVRGYKVPEWLQTSKIWTY
jgi:hypothetical protein